MKPYEILADDGSYYGEVPVCPGVYANEDALEACRRELEEVLEDWMRRYLRPSWSISPAESASSNA